MKANTWSLVSLAVVSLVLNLACGSSSDDKEETVATSSYTYTADTKKIIDANCATAGCHVAGTSTKAMTTLAEIKAITPTNMSTRIKATGASRMPPVNTSFETSADGVILLNWLAGGADLK